MLFAKVGCMYIYGEKDTATSANLWKGVATLVPIVATLVPSVATLVPIVATLVRGVATLVQNLVGKAGGGGRTWDLGLQGRVANDSAKGYGNCD